MDGQPESSAGTGVRNGECDEDDEPWCLAGESQEPDSLSDVEASVLELYASVRDDAPRAGSERRRWRRPRVQVHVVYARSVS